LYQFLTDSTGLGRFSGDGDAIGLSDVYRQVGARDEYGSISGNNAIIFQTGHVAVLLRDESATRNGARWAGLWIEPSDPHYAQVVRLIQRGDFEALSDLVAPDAVLASSREVIDSQTCRTMSNGSDDRYAPDNRGGYGHRPALGNYIIRQGEWYFLPRPDLEFPENVIEKPLNDVVDNPLDSHVPRDLVVVDGELDQRRLGDTLAVPDGIYVRGTIRHQRNEHAMFNLYDHWHAVIENTEDCYTFDSSRGGRWE